MPEDLKTRLHKIASDHITEREAAEVNVGFALNNAAEYSERVIKPTFSKAAQSWEQFSSQAQATLDLAPRGEPLKQSTVTFKFDGEPIIQFAAQVSASTKGASVFVAQTSLPTRDYTPHVILFLGKESNSIVDVTKEMLEDALINHLEKALKRHVPK